MVHNHKMGTVVVQNCSIQRHKWAKLETISLKRRTYGQYVTSKNAFQLTRSTFPLHVTTNELALKNYLQTWCYSQYVF